MKTIVIAEIGENHFGQWDLCKGLTTEAARRGAAIAKFQTYKADQVPPDHPEREWFELVAMPEGVHYEMQEHCGGLGIRFLSSPFSVGAARFLVEDLKCEEIKVASRMLVYPPMLDFLNDHSDQVKTVYLSTGMATMAEIREGLRHLDKIKKVYLLHCVSLYPTEDAEAELRCLTTLQREFPGFSIGYSDHTRGIDACLAAVALGAEVLEKHFTYNARMPGSDHEGGMTPDDLAEMVKRIGRLEQMLGSGKKAPTPREKEILPAMRGSWAEVEFRL